MNIHDEPETLPLPPDGALSDDGRIWTGPVPCDDWIIADATHRAAVGEVVTIEADLARVLWHSAVESRNRELGGSR